MRRSIRRPPLRLQALVGLLLPLITAGSLAGIEHTVTDPTSAPPSPSAVSEAPTPGVHDVALDSHTRMVHVRWFEAAQAQAAAVEARREEREAVQAREARARERAEEAAARRARMEQAAVRKRREARLERREARTPGVLAPFRVAAFNALGHSHTVPGGNRPGWLNSATRTGFLVTLLESHRVDVVGLQEFQPQQRVAFQRRAGARWAVHTVGANAVAWRRSQFVFVSAATVSIPYFGGRLTPQPVVRLRSLVTGQEMNFLSVHNPADARGPAQRWRDEAIRRQIDWLDAQRDAPTPVPSFLLGDLNDREEAFCPLMRTGFVASAAGGGASAAGCSMPAFGGVDWMFATKGVRFTGFAADRGPLVSRASDHPFIVATAGS